MRFVAKCIVVLGCGIAAVGCAVGGDSDDPSVAGESAEVPPEIRNLPDVESAEDTGGVAKSALVAGTTSICTNSIYGPSQRYDNVSILTGDNEATSRAVLVTDAARQRTQRQWQVAFVEAGGWVDETYARRFGTWAYVAERGALVNFGGDRAFVQNNASVSCQAGATTNIMNTAGAQILGCTRNLQANTPKFWRCSSTTPVSQVFPTVSIAATRSGDKVTFRNTSRGYYESVQWSILKNCPADEEYTWTDVSTSPTGFTATLPKSACVGASYQVYLNLRSRGFAPTSNYRNVP